MQRTSLNSGRRNCMETGCLSVDAFPGHVRFGCRHKADRVELGQEPPPPPHPGPRQVAARHGPGFCCGRSAGGVEAGCPAAGPEAAHGLTCPERSLSSLRAQAGGGRRAPRGRGGPAGARPVGGRLQAPGFGLRAPGRRAPGSQAGSRAGRRGRARRGRAGAGARGAQAEHGGAAGLARSPRPCPPAPTQASEQQVQRERRRRGPSPGPDPPRAARPRRRPLPPPLAAPGPRPLPAAFCCHCDVTKGRARVETSSPP